MYRSAHRGNLAMHTVFIKKVSKTTVYDIWHAQFLLRVESLRPSLRREVLAYCSTTHITHTHPDTENKTDTLTSFCHDDLNSV